VQLNVRKTVQAIQYIRLFCALEVKLQKWRQTLQISPLAPLQDDVTYYWHDPTAILRLLWRFQQLTYSVSTKKQSQLLL